jgi:hypothetical protein
MQLSVLQTQNSQLVLHDSYSASFVSLHMFYPADVKGKIAFDLVTCYPMSVAGYWRIKGLE